MLTTPFFSRPELVGQPVARGPSTTRGVSTASTRSTATSSARTRAGTRWSTSTSSCRRRASSPTRSTGSRCAATACTSPHDGGDPRRPVAGAAAPRRRRRATTPAASRRSTGPTRGGCGRSSGGQRRGRRATANRPGVVGAISSVRKKCDSSSPEPMPVRGGAERPVDDRQHALVAPTRTSCGAPCGGDRGDRAGGASRRWRGAARSRRAARACPRAPAR